MQGFAKIATPLTGLLQKTQAWTWRAEQQAAFQKLKEAMSTAPVLAYLDESLPFVIAADASDLAVGAVLQQDQGKGLQPIAYFSRKLHGAELNWSTHEKEALAQVLALKEWWCYVEGVQFVLETNHSPLRYLQTQPQLSRKQARWLEFFQQFSFDVRYRKGLRNQVADALSRLQVQQIEATWILQPGWMEEIKQAMPADLEARATRQEI